MRILFRRIFFFEDLTWSSLERKIKVIKKLAIQFYNKKKPYNLCISFCCNLYFALSELQPHISHGNFFLPYRP